MTPWIVRCAPKDGGFDSVVARFADRDEALAYMKQQDYTCDIYSLEYEEEGA